MIEKEKVLSDAPKVLNSDNNPWFPVNKIDNLNRDFLPMLRLSFELEFGTHLQTALVI